MGGLYVVPIDQKLQVLHVAGHDGAGRGVEEVPNAGGIGAERNKRVPLAGRRAHQRDCHELWKNPGCWIMSHKFGQVARMCELVNTRKPNAGF